MNAFLALTTAQFKGFIRDKQTLFWTIAFPLMFLLIFGAIFGGSSDQASKSSLVQVGDVAFIDQMPGEARAAFDGLFEVTRTSDTADALDQLKRGKVDGVVEANGPTGMTLHYAAADHVASARLVGVMDGFVSQANVAATGQPARFSLATAQVEDASLKPIQYMVPGILGYAVAMGAIFGGAMALVNWRRTKLLRKLRLAPVTTPALIGARTLIALFITTLQTLVFLVVGMVLFDLKLTGSWYLIVPLLICATLAFLTIGLFAGSVSKTEEGASGLANLIILPMAFASGSFIPLDEAPSWLQRISDFLPLGWVNSSMLDVMVRDQGVSAIVRPCLMLLAFGLVMVLISSRFFRWEAD